MRFSTPRLHFLIIVRCAIPMGSPIASYYFFFYNFNADILLLWFMLIHIIYLSWIYWCQSAWYPVTKHDKRVPFFTSHCGVYIHNVDSNKSQYLIEFPQAKIKSEVLGVKELVGGMPRKICGVLPPLLKLENVHWYNQFVQCSIFVL